jgi:hypothetical protein
LFNYKIGQMKNKLKTLIASIFISLTLLTTWHITLVQGETHSQPPIIYTNMFGRLGKLAFNLYFNPKLVNHEYVLSQDDKVCVGNTVNINSTDLGGEWFAKGGPTDSPPITWVTPEQMNEIMSNVSHSKSKTGTHETSITYPVTYPRYPGAVIAFCSCVHGITYANYQLPGTIVSNKEVLGMEITLYKTPLWSDWWLDYRWAYGTMICTNNVEIALNGQATANEIAISSEGQLQFEIKTRPTCYFYLEKTIQTCSLPTPDECACDYSKLPTDCPERHGVYEQYFYSFSKPIEGPNMSTTINLFAVSESNGPSLEIISKSSVISNGQITIMLTIKNTGQASAILDDVTSSIPLTITYKPSVIKPGTTENIFLQTTQPVDLNSLDFQLSYRSEPPDCTATTITTTTPTTQPTMQITSCSFNYECSTNLCCQNQCRDPTKGACTDINGDGLLEWVPYE